MCVHTYRTQSPNTSIIFLSIHTEWLRHFVGNGWQTSLSSSIRWKRERTKNGRRERERERSLHSKQSLLCCAVLCASCTKAIWMCVRSHYDDDNRLDIIITVECFSVSIRMRHTVKTLNIEHHTHRISFWLQLKSCSSFVFNRFVDFHSFRRIIDEVFNAASMFSEFFFEFCFWLCMRFVFLECVCLYVCWYRCEWRLCVQLITRTFIVEWINVCRISA